MLTPAVEPMPRSRRRHALALLSIGFAALAVLHTGLVRTFTGVVSPRVGLNPVGVAAPSSRVPCYAEVVDAEVSDAEDDDDDGSDDAEEGKEPVKSVFDGPTERTRFRARFRNKWYTVFKSKYTFYRYEVTEKPNGPVLEKGLWNQHYGCPQEYYAANEKYWMRRLRKKMRKLRMRHGHGQAWPNGRAIYLEKLRGSPILKKWFPKYRKRAQWKMSPKEVTQKEQKIRARKLQRSLAVEMEQRRLERLRELGVWAGEEAWRRPYIPKVDHRVW